MKTFYGKVATERVQKLAVIDCLTIVAEVCMNESFSMGFFSILFHTASIVLFTENRDIKSLSRDFSCGKPVRTACDRKYKTHEKGLKYGCMLFGRCAHFRDNLILGLASKKLKLLALPSDRK